MIKPVFFCKFCLSVFSLIFSWCQLSLAWKSAKKLKMIQAKIIQAKIMQNTKTLCWIWTDFSDQEKKIQFKNKGL